MGLSIHGQQEDAGIAQSDVVSASGLNRQQILACFGLTEHRLDILVGKELARRQERRHAGELSDSDVDGLVLDPDSDEDSWYHILMIDDGVERIHGSTFVLLLPCLV